jgi:hypothetical protein
MATAATNGNGAYLVIGNEKFPIKNSLAQALQALVLKQENETGRIIIDIKSGGVSAVRLETVWVE